MENLKKQNASESIKDAYLFSIITGEHKAEANQEVAFQIIEKANRKNADELDQGIYGHIISSI